MLGDPVTMGSAYQRFNVVAPVLGLMQDRPGELVDPRAAVTLDNFVFRRGELRKVRGWTAGANSATGAVNYIDTVRLGSGSSTTHVGTDQYIYDYDGGTLAALNDEPFSMVAGDFWSADYLYKRWYFTNITDGLWERLDDNDLVQSVDVAANAEADPPVEAVPVSIKAKYLAQFAGHVVLANVAGDDARGAYTWAGSSLLDVEADPVINWLAGVPNSDYFADEIHEDAKPIQRLLRLGNDQLVVYKSGSVHLITYYNGVYTVRSPVTNRGLLAPRGVLDMGDYHVHLAGNGLYSFNGSSSVPFQPRIWSYLMERLTDDDRVKVWLFHDTRNREVYVCYQDKVDGAGRALVWNYELDAWTRRAWPFTAAGPIPAGSTSILSFDEMTEPMDSYTSPIQPPADVQQYAILTGNSAGGLFVHDENTLQAAGSDIVATYETGDFAFDAHERVKILGGLDIEATAMSGSPLQVYVGTRRTLADAITWSGPYTYNAGDRGVNFLKNGVWFRFKFVKADGDLALRGFAPRLQVRGWH